MTNVSIIICTRNRCAALRHTLREIEGHVANASLATELVVVDNGSTDETAAFLATAAQQNPDLRFVREDQVGQAVARNTGLAQCHGNVIVFTDDDVVPRPGWLDGMTAPLFEGHADALAGSIIIPPHLMRPWMSRYHLGWLASTAPLSTDSPEYAVGANMSFSRTVLDHVPRFDPALGPGRLGFWDDTLFSMQLKQAGLRLAMASEAAVEHHFDPVRLTRQSFLARAASEGRSLAHVAWHWRHEDRRLPMLRSLRRELELRTLRILRANDCAQPEGMAVWEMKLVSSVAFLRYFARLKSQPRIYSRLGLPPSIKAPAPALP